MLKHAPWCFSGKRLEAQPYHYLCAMQAENQPECRGSTENHSVQSISAQFCSSTSPMQNSPLLLQATGIPLPAPEMEGDCEIQHPLSTAGPGDSRELGQGQEHWQPVQGWEGRKESCASAHATGWGLVLAGRSRRKNCILLRDTDDHPGSGFIERPSGISFLGLYSAPAWDIPLVG